MEFAPCPGGLSVVEDKFFGQDGAVCTVLAWKEGKQHLEKREKKTCWSPRVISTRLRMRILQIHCQFDNVLKVKHNLTLFSHRTLGRTTYLKGLETINHAWHISWTLLLYLSHLPEVQDHFCLHSTSAMANIGVPWCSKFSTILSAGLSLWR